MKGKMSTDGIIRIILLSVMIVLLIFICVKWRGRNFGGSEEPSGSDSTASEDSASGEEDSASWDEESEATEVSGFDQSAPETSVSDEENPDSSIPDSTVLDANINMEAEVKEMFKAVLLGDVPFLYVADAKPENVNVAPYFVPYVSDGNAETMNIADVISIFYGDWEAKIWIFSVADLDGDGEDEVILYLLTVAGDMNSKIILHRIGDEIYGYRTGWRTMGELKTDGTYDYSDPSGINEAGIVTVTEFSETGYTVEKLFYKTGGHPDGWTAFFVDGQPVTEEEYRDADAGQGEKPDAEWYEFTEENIKAMF